MFFLFAFFDTHPTTELQLPFNFTTHTVASFSPKWERNSVETTLIYRIIRILEKRQPWQMLQLNRHYNWILNYMIESMNNIVFYRLGISSDFNQWL